MTQLNDALAQVSITRGNNAVHGPEWRVIFPVSLRRSFVYDHSQDEMAFRRRRLFIGFGKIPYVRFGFHLRAAIQ